MSGESQYRSQRYCVGDDFFKNAAFNVPVYQRMYVWEEEQVKTLIDDLCGAYNNNESHYYLGGIIIAKMTGQEGAKYNLIDGQQRFTTLLFLRRVLQENPQRR